jgi:CTP synthase
MPADRRPPASGLRRFDTRGAAVTIAAMFGRCFGADATGCRNEKGAAPLHQPETNPVLQAVRDVSDETEFYTPLPTGYRKGQVKYVAVVGTVMSGLGKGIFASSLAKLLQDGGLRVAPIKLEGYLNVDSGTLNPFRHGEVFVLDDGMECDMDLGTYERMLDRDLTRDNFATSGQIYSRVLEKERDGRYLGRDVQTIPHLTGEVKLRLRELAVRQNADVVFVEVGGTVGDYENGYLIEALRELAFEEGPNCVCFVALTYILQPQILGEQKSKAAQLGIKRLMEMGVQPHIIACRAPSPVTAKVREKIALYTNVPMNRVFSMHDLESIYQVPEALHAAGLDREVISILNLANRTDEAAGETARRNWRWYTDRVGKGRRPVTIGLMGKYITVRDAYASIEKALEHCGVHLDAKVSIDWVDTTELKEANIAERFAKLQGIIVPGGFGRRGVEGKILAVEYARTRKVPFLGICYGFQMAVIEFARHVCGLTGAASTEIEPATPHPVIDILPGQKHLNRLGGNMRLGGHDVLLTPGSLAARLYGGAERVRLRFRHRYEVHPDYIERLEAGGMVFSGRAPGEPIMQMLELPGHPFFVGTQAHPCLGSRPLRPEPLFRGLVAAALVRADPSLRFEALMSWSAPNAAAEAAPAGTGPAEPAAAEAGNGRAVATAG